MQHRTVEDLMTREVIRVRPDTPFKDVVRLLAEHGVTAVPVVNEQDNPVGVVSEADLLRHEAARPDPGGRAASLGMRPGDRDRAAAETAEGLMTSPAVTARAQWSIVEAAREMTRHQVKRMPVVNEAGHLVGIISRSDLLRVFLRQDSAIREEITREVLRDTLSLSSEEVQVSVVDGVVTLTGRVRQRSLIPIAMRLCQAVDGVVTVHGVLDSPGDNEFGAAETANPDSVVGYTQRH
ncbi:CBS domain-containing protein [Streptomyces sp. NBC_00879]|uniref:CBS domain-containing protein n=1 Tax=Streptomyces sp. NBC_00879 TaxID=2975855 RepID=UPI003862F786|nr:CBS domain-containing protein [Streptomyces sp. NBC_00879]